MLSLWQILFKPFMDNNNKRARFFEWRPNISWPTGTWSDYIIKEAKKINLIWILQVVSIWFLLLVIASVAYVSKFRDNVPEEVVVDTYEDYLVENDYPYSEDVVVDPEYTPGKG